MTACYMVERRNQRTVERQVCDRGHGDDESCNENRTISEHFFDAFKVGSSGPALLEGVTFMYGLPEGAMWWSDMAETHRPASASDWPVGTMEQAEYDAYRARKERLPIGVGWIRPTPDARRQPSNTFEDGLHLVVQTPGGEWNIDSRASNCTMPYDYLHRCWVRHGEAPIVTVDKVGVTCAAGAGSIQCGTYHGFLQNGSLT